MSGRRVVFFAFLLGLGCASPGGVEAKRYRACASVVASYDLEKCHIREADAEAAAYWRRHYTEQGELPDFVSLRRDWKWNLAFPSETEGARSVLAFRRREAFLRQAEVVREVLLRGGLPCSPKDRVCSEAKSRESFEAATEAHEREQVQAAMRAYTAGFNEGFDAERERYERVGNLWTESLRRPRACTAIPKECGDVDGRRAFSEALSEGREACAEADISCAEEPKAVTSRRRVEFIAGLDDGYAKVLLAYQDYGVASLGRPGEAMRPSDCRARPRPCGEWEGRQRAFLAVLEGRERCSDEQPGCREARGALRAQELLRVSWELSALVRERKARAAADREMHRLQEKREEERAVEDVALLPQPEPSFDWLSALRSEATVCGGTFGVTRQARREEALGRFDAMSETARASLGLAVLEEVVAARAANGSFVPRRCFAGV